MLCLFCILYSCKLFEKEFILPLPHAKEASGINAVGFTAHWQKVTGATGYKIDIAQDKNFTRYIGSYQDKSVEGTSFVVNQLEANTTYYYRVRAHISNQISQNSQIIEVTTTALNAPVAYAASHVQPLSFRAHWEKMPLALTYTLEVATDRGFTSIVKNMTGLNDTTVVADGLVINQEYFYRVKAQQSQSFSAYSNIQTVTTNALPAPVALAPDNQRAFYFTANWQKSDGPEVSVFLIDVATDSEFKEFLPGYQGKEVAGTTLEVTTLNFRQTYYYRVRAKRLDKISAYSATMEVSPCISNSCKLAGIVFTTNGATRDFDQTFAYDAQNRLETINYPRLTNSHYKVSYDTDNSIKTVVYTLNGALKYTYAYTYNADKLLTTVYLTNSTGGFIEFWQFAYNNQRQRLSWTVYRDMAGATIVKQFNYTYDARGNVILVKDQAGTVLRRYTYEDKLSPYALFGQDDLCFFIAHFRDQWTRPSPIGTSKTFDYEWRGFFPINSIKNVETTAWSDEGFQYEYNSKDVVIKQKFYFTVNFSFTGCSF